MSNPANLGDPRLERYAGASESVAQAWLDAVWRALQGEVPGIRERAAADSDLADVAGDLVVSATLRVLRNPEGNKSEASSLDDYSESFTRSDSTMDVYFTAAELSRVKVDAGASGAPFVGSVKYL